MKTEQSMHTAHLLQDAADDEVRRGEDQQHRGEEEREVDGGGQEVGAGALRK